MANRLIDLSDPTVTLPGRLVLDSNVIIDGLLAQAYGTSGPLLHQHQRADALVDQMHRQGSIGLITGTSLNEVFHFIVKAAFRAALPDNLAALRERFPKAHRPAWNHLYKMHPSLFRQIMPDLERTRRLMADNGLLVLQPIEVSRIVSGRSLEEELLWAMGRYELDSSDAAIVIETQRAGVRSLVTADRDLWRAHLDLDIYTWQNQAA